MFTAVFDFRDLERVLHRITTYLETRAMETVAPIVIKDIREKSAKGIDAHSQAFAAYTPDYLKWRVAHKLPTKPNLRVKTSNSLLDRLAYEDGKVGVPAEIEGQAEGVNAKREFMSTGPDTSQKIEQAIAHDIDNLT